MAIIKTNKQWRHDYSMDLIPNVQERANWAMKWNALKWNALKWNAASFFLKRFVWIVDWEWTLLLTNGDGALTLIAKALKLLRVVELIRQINSAATENSFSRCLMRRLCLTHLPIQIHSNSFASISIRFSRPEVFYLSFAILGHFITIFLIDLFLFPFLLSFSSFIYFFLWNFDGCEM